MTLGTGFRIDVPTIDEMQFSASRYHNVAMRMGTLPKSGGFNAELWPLRQEGDSCTGHFLSRIMFWMLGIKMSPYLVWYNALVEQLGLNNVTNMGVGPRAMMRAAYDHGMCPWESWNPKSAGFALPAPPSDGRSPGLAPAMARMQAQRFLPKLRPIFAEGDVLVQRLADSLRRRKGVGVVVEVDDAFENPFNGVVGPPSGPSRGLHIVACSRWRTVGREVQLWHEGSWGRSYGVNGGAWLSAARVGAAPWATDCETVLEVGS